MRRIFRTSFDSSRVAFVVLMVAMNACSRTPAPTASITASKPAPEAATRQAAQREAAMVSLGIEELRNRAQLALHEQRLYAPAGDNAIEYYLALRKASTRPDAAAESALIDLQPYAVIGAEQALNRQEFAEAERLRQLIANADPMAPSLERIATAIEHGRQAQVERANALAAAAAKAAATPPVAAPTEVTATAPVSAPPMTPAGVPVAGTAAKPAAPTPTAPAATTMAPPSPPTPKVVPVVKAPSPTKSQREAVAIRAPQPPYPPEERRFGTSAEIKATFTIQPDGSVDGINVESVGTRRVAFERNVRNTLRRWQFEPIGEARSVTRMFTFMP